jgi:CheY-like chemotaxis protein
VAGERTDGGGPAEILLVEDNAGDVRLVQEALAGVPVLVRLTVTRHGDEALAVLRREGQHAGARRPDLILLDLNLPRASGRELLAEIKADDHLRRIPVVVLTSSQAEHDILDAYGRHANCYVTKPFDLDEFSRVVRHIVVFWLTVVQLPRG